MLARRLRCMCVRACAYVHMCVYICVCVLGKGKQKGERVLRKCFQTFKMCAYLWLCVSVCVNVCSHVYIGKVRTIGQIYFFFGSSSYFLMT